METLLKSKYCKVSNEDFESFLSYLQASLRQVEDLKNYVFINNPSLEEASLEEEEYEFLRIPNLDTRDEEDLFQEICKIFKMYNKLFEKMENQWRDDDVSYYERLKYSRQDNRVLLEHICSWLEKSPPFLDDSPEDIWLLRKSQAILRDIIIIKTYIKTLKLILRNLNNLKCVKI